MSKKTIDNSNSPSRIMYNRDFSDPPTHSNISSKLQRNLKMNTLAFQDQVDINDHLHQTLRQPKPRSSLRGKINMKRSLKLINREMAKSKNTPRLKNYDMKIHDVCRFHISQIK